MLIYTLQMEPVSEFYHPLQGVGVQGKSQGSLTVQWLIPQAPLAWPVGNSQVVVWCGGRRNQVVGVCLLTRGEVRDR